MVRRSFALAHNDDETQRALSLYVEARIYPISRSLQVQEQGKFFVSVLGKEGYLMPRLGAIVIILYHQVTNENTFEDLQPLTVRLKQQKETEVKMNPLRTISFPPPDVTILP